MNIDTTKIEGYADMTLEDKLKALEAYEFDTPTPDYSGYVDKKTFDKTSSDLAEQKRLLAEQKKMNMARMSDEERRNAEIAEKIRLLEEDNARLKRQSVVQEYKAKYLGMGYSEALAAESAEAFADGDYEKVFANQLSHQTAREKEVKAGLYGKMPTPPAGGGSTGMTKEAILKIEDADARMKAIAENLDLFNDGL